MAWLIQRIAPLEPVAYWGRADRWVLRRAPVKIAEVLKPRIPECAARYHDYDAAYDVAQHLRATQPLAYGELISVQTEPEPA